eukprot:RCo032837
MSMATSISSVTAMEVLDSLGFPTLRASLKCGSATFSATVPAGSTVGLFEALELRDEDVTRFVGKGCLKAASIVSGPVAQKLQGRSVKEQRAADKVLRTLDGSANKATLGSNSLLGVSMAICRAGASVAGVPLYRHVAQLCGTAQVRLPVPIFTVLRGGRHTGNALHVQEFLILPVGVKSFAEAARVGCEVYYACKALVQKKYGLEYTNNSEAMGMAPPMKDTREALDLLSQATESTGHTGLVKFGLHCAASDMWVEDKKMYDLAFKSHKPNLVPGEALVQSYLELVAAYPIVALVDPLDQNDWERWVALTAALRPQGVTVVGDDLTVGHPERVGVAVNKQACGAMLLKLAQVGTVTEALDIAKQGMRSGWSVLCCGSTSGETEDTFIADFAVGLGCGWIKLGAPCRGECTAKLNQLLRLEEELGSDTGFGPPGLSKS